ncbi:lamin tail domain-containing protein [Candidatus Azambacteria bacterium]|nr:lamin tail domain-containing protein [Candidatus Azambacteria bacterium]
MTKKISFFLIVFAFISLVFFQQGRGYDDKTTHPGLTDEMVDFYNASFDAKLTSEEKEWIVQGAIDEDIPPRWINHFYDPIYNEGWKAENLGTVPPSTLRFLSGIFFNINTEIVSSKQWVHDEVLQARYTSYGGNNTWENAIRQYANGNKKDAYYILGHVLHLLEDKTVPDHTRNDTHAHEGSFISGDGGSPYEDYGRNFNRQNLTTAQELRQLNKQPFFLPSIDEYFDYLAKYSNGYFFSEHTINLKKYTNPKIIKERIYNNDLFLGYSKDKDGIEFPLVKIKETFDTGSGGVLREYSVNEKYILENYFSRLTQEAVLSGAGVIKLFHEEAERAKQNKASISPVPQISWWQQMRSPLYGGIALYNNVNETVVSAYSFVTSFTANTISFFGNYSNLFAAQLSGLISTNAQPAPAPAVVVVQEPALVPVEINAGSPIPPQSIDVPAETAAAPTIAAPQVTPAAEMITVPPPANVVEIPAIISEAIVDVLPLPAPVYRGSASVTGVSPDALVAQNNTPLTAAETQTTNTTTATTSTNDTLATTTDSTFATTTDATKGDTATSTEEVIVSATPTEPVIAETPEVIDGPPVVINEIAWMGTKAQANDEWIELYNKTNSDIDLSGWMLESRNQRFSVALQGVILAKGYFLLERTASTTTDQAENMTYSSHKGVLVDSGPDANVYLKNGTTTVDNVDFNNRWIAGENGVKRTMERVSPYATSTLSYNWKTYSEALTPPFAKAAIVDGIANDILGTPGAKNSVTGYYTPTGGVTENTVWRKAYSPYYVPASTAILQNATLTIEPGTVVKFAKGGYSYPGGLEVHGVLKAEGTQADQIIFTSFLDDAVDGIDSNQDGKSTSPAPADWMRIDFFNTTKPSVIRYAKIYYGGQGYTNANGYPMYSGAVNIQNASPVISDSLFDGNKAISLYVKGDSHPIITGNTIKNTVTPYGYGIQLANASSTADIIGNIFEDNGVGISSESATSTPLIVRDNTFARNQKNGEFKGGTDFNLDNANNQDSERKGGFYIRLVVSEGQTKTLKQDTMPYILESGFTVAEGGTLTIEPGAVIKSKNLNDFGSFAVPFIIEGTLRAQGTAAAPIVFTAFADDSDGYDSDGSAAAPTPGAWKNIQFIGATSSDSILEYVSVRYGGRGTNVCPYAYFSGPCMEYKGAVLVQDASPTISHAAFNRNLAIAIFVEGDAQPIIEYSDIRDTQVGVKSPRETIGGIGISIGAQSTPTLTDNTFSNNLEDVIDRP